MGEMVEFPSNGHSARGYLGRPESGSGPGLIVLQEFWGLVPHIKDLCERFAREGFVALAPDLFRGDTAEEPDEAGKLMMALNLDQAARDLSGAVSFLQGDDEVSPRAVGVTGFCMGGGLALVTACQQGPNIGACVPFYGVIPWEQAQPDWDNLTAPVQIHVAENDDMFGPEAAADIEAKLNQRDKHVDVHIYPGTGHGFFNDTRPEVYDPRASGLAWDRTLAFLRAHLIDLGGQTPGA